VQVFKGSQAAPSPRLRSIFGARIADDETDTVSAPDSRTGPVPRIKGHTERHPNSSREQRSSKRASQKEVDSLRMVVAPSTPRSRRHRFSRA
jgi:hypothetical protein